MLQTHQGTGRHPKRRVLNCVSSIEYSIDLLGVACSGRGPFVAQWETRQPLLAQAAWFLQHTCVSSQYSRGVPNGPVAQAHACCRIQLVGSAVLRNHVFVAMTHTCVWQTPGNWRSAEAPGSHPSKTGSGRGACAGCLVSATHMCVIPTQAGHPGIAPRRVQGSHYGVSPVDLPGVLSRGCVACVVVRRPTQTASSGLQF